MSRYPLFDRRRLLLRDLAERGHDLAWSDCAALLPPTEPYDHPEFPELVQRLLTARHAGRPVLLLMGAHPIKLGLSRYLIDLVERRLITHVATNGAGVIHDFELALAGGTSEDVARWLAAGQFGLWRQTARLNTIIRQAARRREGLGEAAGRVITEKHYPHQDLSLAAACWRVGTPLTCHVSIGSDILHALPNCAPAALGRASYTDFLIFAHAVEDLEGGVVLNLGSAVMGPEVFLKALAMARNVAHQQGRTLTQFTTAVFDLQPLPEHYRDCPPSKDRPLYYYRPWKTLLVRAVADGRNSFYFAADHRQTVPTLWHHLVTTA